MSPHTIGPSACISNGSGKDRMPCARLSTFKFEVRSVKLSAHQAQLVRGNCSFRSTTHTTIDGYLTCWHCLCCGAVRRGRGQLLVKGHTTMLKTPCSVSWKSDAHRMYARSSPCCRHQNVTLPFVLCVTFSPWATSQRFLSLHFHLAEVRSETSRWHSWQKSTAALYCKGK